MGMTASNLRTALEGTSTLGPSGSTFVVVRSEPVVPASATWSATWWRWAASILFRMGKDTGASSCASSSETDTPPVALYGAIGLVIGGDSLVSHILYRATDGTINRRRVNNAWLRPDDSGISEDLGKTTLSDVRARLVEAYQAAIRVVAHVSCDTIRVYDVVDRDSTSPDSVCPRRVCVRDLTPLQLRASPIQWQPFMDWTVGGTGLVLRARVPVKDVDWDGGESLAVLVLFIGTAVVEEKKTGGGGTPSRTTRQLFRWYLMDQRWLDVVVTPVSTADPLVQMSRDLRLVQTLLSTCLKDGNREILFDADNSNAYQSLADTVENEHEELQQASSDAFEEYIGEWLDRPPPSSCSPAIGAWVRVRSLPRSVLNRAQDCTWYPSMDATAGQVGWVVGGGKSHGKTWVWHAGHCVPRLFDDTWLEPAEAGASDADKSMVELVRSIRATRQWLHSELGRSKMYR